MQARLPLGQPGGLAVRHIEKSMAAEVVVKEHYLHRKPPMSFCFGLYDGDELVGVCTFGCPPSRHLQKSACPLAPSAVIELNRLWCSERMPKNTESWFISRALKMLPARIVVSYADTAVGHYGAVYRASNWFYSGITDADRKTPRFDYIPNSGGHTRDSFRTGYTEKRRRLPKHKYWTVTGDKSERRKLKKMCGWPEVKWEKKEVL